MKPGTIASDHKTPAGRPGWFHRVFQLFKYAVYALLVINLALFFREDWLASDHTFATGVTAGDVFEAFSATVDTFAWIVLLLLFELETYVIPDRRLEGALRWSLHGIRAISYVFIVFAFYGYSTKAAMLYDTQPLEVADVCTLVDGDLSFIDTLDEYLTLDYDNCREFRRDTQWHRLSGREIVADQASLQAARWLAWTDVINAGAWLLIVLVLELDVRLQPAGRLRGWVFAASNVFKGLLYLTLLGAAIYWGIEGDFLDFWDAFLWIVAFVFIEMNILAWHETTSGAGPDPERGSAVAA